MKYTNFNVVFATFNGDGDGRDDEAIYIHNVVDGADDLLKIMPRQEPKTFLDKAKEIISPSVNSQTILGEEKDAVLADPFNYIVEISEPGTAQVCFIDSNGFINSGAYASVLPVKQNTIGSSDAGIWVHGMTDRQLVKTAESKGIFVMPEDDCFDHTEGFAPTLESSQFEMN